MKQEYITDTILTNTIAALNEQISALQSALSNLQATVNSKVSQDDFNSLQSVVNTKASQSSLDSLSNTVSGRVSTIEGQYVKSSNIRTITKMTSSEYASSSKDANTAYFVTD